MSEIIPGKAENSPKVPLWYSKASREAKRDGERLREQILEWLFPTPPDKWPDDEKAHAAPYMPLGLLHQACVGMAERTYQASVKSVQHAAEGRAKSKENPQGANKHAYRRVYKIARNLEHSLAEITPAMVRDAIVDCVFPLARADQDQKRAVNLLEVWRQQHNLPPEQILPALVKQHQQNIENRNRSVVLNQESAVQMPGRFVEKTWQLQDSKGVSKTYAVHVLATDAQLDLEGFIMENCVGGDSWKHQIKVRPNGKPETIILSIGAEVPQGIVMEDIEGLTDRMLGVANQERADAENILLEDQMSYLEDRDGDRRREEINRQHDVRQKEVEEKLKLKVCRIPEITIEYNVDSHRIMQIVGHGNMEITSEHALGSLLLKILGEISQKVSVRGIGGLDGFDVLERILTPEGPKKITEVKEGEQILWYPDTYYPDADDTVADVRAWAKLPVKIDLMFADSKRCAALTDIAGSLMIGGGRVQSPDILLPNLRTVKGEIEVYKMDRVEMPELIEAKAIKIVGEQLSRPDASGFHAIKDRVIAPKFDQSKIQYVKE